MKNKISYFAALIALLILASCGNQSSKFEGIPFKVSEKGLWGIITPSGEVLYEDEFKNKPTLVKEGMFMVKNDNDLWEIYKAEEKPKKVGGEYVQATLFSDGVALVAERNRPVTIINTEGKEVAVIDKVDGKSVTSVQPFSEGYAVYKTGELYGVINKKGKGVVAAKYCVILPCSDGKFVAIKEKYAKALQEGGGTKNIKFSVLDTKGDELFEISGSKYSEVGPAWKDGLLAVAVESDGEKRWGLINEKQEVVVKPSDKFKEIYNISDNRFIYSNGDSYGVMNIDGESLIRAKYDHINFDGDGYTVYNIEDDNAKWKFIDKDDNQIGDDKYQDLVAFRLFDGEHTLVKVADNFWSLIDREGKQLKKLPDMVDVSLGMGDDEVESDYVDFTALFDDMQLSANGLDGLTFQTTPHQAVTALASYLYHGTSADEYEYKSTLAYSRQVLSEGVAFKVDFDGCLSNQTYHTESVYAYTDYWGEDRYYEQQVPAGCEWSNVKVKDFYVSIDHTHGKMYGKLRQLLKAFINRFGSAGKIVKQNNGAAIIKLNNGKVAVVYMTSDAVTATWGNLPVDAINIDQFENVKEAGLGGGSDAGYTDPSSIYEEVDSAVADTDYCY